MNCVSNYFLNCRLENVKKKHDNKTDSMFAELIMHFPCFSQIISFNYNCHLSPTKKNDILYYFYSQKVLDKINILYTQIFLTLFLYFNIFRKHFPEKFDVMLTQIESQFITHNK